MVEVRGVSHSYEHAASFQFPDFSCGPADQWLFLGDSGCGKTTFLHIIAGLIRPKKGQVIIQGQDIFTLNESERDAFRGSNIGIVFQQAHLIGALTIQENLLISPYRWS